MPRDMENYRARKRKKYQENAEKERARKSIYNATHKERINELQRKMYLEKKDILYARKKFQLHCRKGLIVRPKSCSSCGKECFVEGHHEDYTKWDIVIWLCKQCHLEKHRGARKEIYKDW